MRRPFSAAPPLPLAQLRRRRMPAFQPVAHFQKIRLLPRWRAHAQHPHRFARHILQRMRRIGRNIHGGPSANRRSLAPERKRQLPFQQREHLLEIMPVRRRPSPRRYKHIDQAIPPRRIRPTHQNRISPARQRDIRQSRIVHLRHRQPPPQIIRRNSVKVRHTISPVPSIVKSKQQKSFGSFLQKRTPFLPACRATATAVPSFGQMACSIRNP